MTWCPPPHTPSPMNQVDILVIFDRSRSVYSSFDERGISDWETSLRFFQRLVLDSDVSSAATRFGLASFSETALIHFGFNMSDDKDVLMDYTNYGPRWKPNPRDPNALDVSSIEHTHHSCIWQARKLFLLRCPNSYLVFLSLDAKIVRVAETARVLRPCSERMPLFTCKMFRSFARQTLGWYWTSWMKRIQTHTTVLGAATPNSWSFW